MAESVLNLPNDVRMLDVVRGGLEHADDVGIAVSFTRFSGLGLLVDPLREVGARGGRVRLLTSTYQCVTQPEALEALTRIPEIETRVQSGPSAFHAKFWWFKGNGRQQCWAGSSNLTKGGLATNIEWNLRRGEPDLIAATKQQFEKLWIRDDVAALDADLIRRYRRVYAEASVAGPPRVEDAAVASIGPNHAQREALAALANTRVGGARRAAIIAATGVGKTFLAAFDVRDTGARSVLYVSHRLEHLLQARRTFSSVLDRKLKLGVVGGGYDQADADVVFATISSLARRPDIASRKFDYLIIDEFHHVEAPSYEVLLPIREHAFLLGITATPERQDGHDVLEWCDWNVAYQVRMPEAIDRGWLLPFHYFGIADETIDFLNIPWRRLEEVEDALSVEARAEHVLRHALERGFDGPKRATVGFCAGKKHARFMADAFNARGQVAAAVLGDQPVEEREEIYRRLANPRHPLQWIFVSDVLNEGVDIPAINSVLFLRPTESATLFLQQLGRGLRLFPGTEVLTVLDFVGHHRSAWLTLKALDSPAGGGERTEIAQGVVVKPPRACEVILQRRTREILEKVEQFTNKREAYNETYKHLRNELGRAPLPVDLWNREDVPGLPAFRHVYGSWIECQRSNGDEPAWSRDLADESPALAFLRAVEANWQAQRVSPYALTWGLCAHPDDPEAGYAEFFARWPQWSGERSPLDGSSTWSTVQRKLGPALEEKALLPMIRKVLGERLLPEVEGRLLFTVNTDHQMRHGGILRQPSDLNLFARYSRPEIIRHFGVQYDPTQHNKGMLWFDRNGVIITKIDTSSAIEAHQYENWFSDAQTFRWTSQPQMKPDNKAGQKLIEHEQRRLRLHLFVQPRSHEPACYMGAVKVTEVRGPGPMDVTLALDQRVPEQVRAELDGEDDGEDEVDG